MPTETKSAKAIINEWFNANINSSPVSRDVDALNYLRERLPKLEAALVDAAPALAEKTDAPKPAATAPSPTAPAPTAQKTG